MKNEYFPHTSFMLELKEFKLVIKNKKKIQYTCIMRISNRPTKSVTDTRRSKTVLNKSADVLQHVAINVLYHCYSTKGGHRQCIHTLNTKGPYPRNWASFLFSTFHIPGQTEGESEPNCACIK